MIHRVWYFNAEQNRLSVRTPRRTNHEFRILEHVMVQYILYSVFQKLRTRGGEKYISFLFQGIAFRARVVKCSRAVNMFFQLAARDVKVSETTTPHKPTVVGSSDARAQRRRAADRSRPTLLFCIFLLFCLPPPPKGIAEKRSPETHAKQL